MMQNRIAYLLEKQLAQEATSAEKEEFLAIVQNAEDDAAVREALTAAWLQFNTEEQMPQQQADAMFNNIIADAEGLHAQPAPRVHGMRTIKMWTRIAAAAVIILMLGAGGYWYFQSNNKITSKVTDQPVVADIPAPASANAILTLANGQQIELNKTATGNIALQGNASIAKLADGQLVYNKNANSPLTTDHSPAYNTLTVPKGSKVVNIVLADGSKVWLDAASSIRYPASFAANERRVELTGQAYFEVQTLKLGSGQKMAFIVDILPSNNGAAKGRVEVLGTHFNIKAYNDETDIKTTLLEGKVKVASGERPVASGREVILKPGEQAVLAHSTLTTNNSPLTINHSPDIEEAMAWKNGRFEFSGNTIEPIMQQVARWYNVDIEYRGPKPTDNFMGGTSREANVSALLKILEQTKAIRFHIEGKKIIVSKP